MAQNIILKRSAVGGNIPTTASLLLGEVAINTNDGKMFIKKNNGTESIVEVGALPEQSGNSGKVLSTNGSEASWVTPSGGSSSSSIDIYLYSSFGGL